MILGDDRWRLPRSTTPEPDSSGNQTAVTQLSRLIGKDRNFVESDTSLESRKALQPCRQQEFGGGKCLIWTIEALSYLSPYVAFREECLGFVQLGAAKKRHAKGY